jgi:single-strand selective monofunctional uracil DNA glycosylase
MAKALVAAALKLREGLSTLRFGSPVAYVYQPLDYAWAAHENYLKRYGAGPKQILFLGMNPGPFGMVQTGIPFGEVQAVKHWLGIDASVGKPPSEHPRRPVEGFNCRRSEVSGRRLWGLFAARFKSATAFFADHFVLNYCPLAFMEPSGRNLTPDQLPPQVQRELFALCDAHLAEALHVLQPEWGIGVGGFAAKRLAEVGEQTLRRGQILHPSPANPLANRDWNGTVLRQMRAIGAWL